MRIGIDATFLAFPLLAQAGIGRYIRGLLHSLGEVDGADEYVIFLGAGDAEIPAGLPPNMVPHLSAFPLQRPVVRVLWHHACLPALAKTLRLDLLFSPAFTLPWRLPRETRGVAMVFDLFFLRFPEMYRGRARLYYLRKAVGRTIRRADAILCSSAATAEDVIHFYAAEPAKVFVTRPGYTPLVDGERGAEDVSSSADEVKSRLGLGPSFILHVGTLEPRKNVRALVEAVTLLRRMGHPGMQLVLVGKGRERFLRENPGLDRGGLEGVVFTGYLPDKEVWALYRSARLFALLSLWEGFGFPLLEAMAAGVPIVASKAGSIPEVVGDAALLVDPTSPAAAAEAMKRILEEDGLRETLLARGRERVRDFQWRKTAEDTSALFRRMEERG